MFESLPSGAGLSLERLRSLVEVEATGGIAAAAPDDPVRQSQISRNLAQLESYFSVELKRRKGKGIELTPAGRRLAALARMHLQALADFAAMETGATVDLRIGASQSTLEWVLLPRLARGETSAGSPRLILENLRSHEVVSRLNDFSLDLGIVRKSAIGTKRLVTRPIETVRYALFTRAGVAKRCQDDPLEVLRRVPLATAMGGEYRRRLDELIEEKGIEPDYRYSCSSFRTALEALKRDREVAALLPDSAAIELEAGRFTALELPFLRSYSRNLVLAWHERIGEIRPSAVEMVERIVG